MQIMYGFSRVGAETVLHELTVEDESDESGGVHGGLVEVGEGDGGGEGAVFSGGTVRM
jgi:hypothetical protein